MRRCGSCAHSRSSGPCPTWRRGRCRPIAFKALRVWSDLDRADSWLHQTGEDRYTLRDPQARALLLDAADLAEARADHARRAVARKRRRSRRPTRRQDR